MRSGHRIAGIVLACLLPVLARAQDDAATYRVEVSFDWSGEGIADHPADAHWARLIAVAHDARYMMFRDGLTASTGMALVATNGRVSIMEAELAEAARRRRTGPPVVLPGVDAGVAQFAFDLTVTPDWPLVSLSTMLAPSPDWFSGVDSVDLREAGGWRDTHVVPMFVWDAGADSGPDYASPDQETQPRESVRLSVHPGFLRPDGIRPIGAARFVRQP